MTNKRKSCRMYSDASAAGNNPRRVQVVMAQFFRQKTTGSLFQSPGGGSLTEHSVRRRSSSTRSIGSSLARSMSPRLHPSGQRTSAPSDLVTT